MKATTRFFALSVAIAVVVPAAAIGDQAIGGNAGSPLIDHTAHVYRGVTKILLRSAELVPEEKYGFTPDADVRPFGEILDHVASSQYFFCSAVLGERAPKRVNTESATKADRITALEEAFAYCGRAHRSMTPSSSVEMVDLMGESSPRLGVLNVNNIHTIEHYGNLVTYMRLLDIVPPTSDQDFMKRLSE